LEKSSNEPTTEAPSIGTPSTGTTSRRAELILLSITVIWGATFGTTKILLDTLPPMVLLTWRFGIASVIFLLFFRKRLAGSLSRTTLLQGSLLGLLLYSGFALQTAGLGLTSSSRSGFITVLYVAMTPLLQVVLTRRLPHRHVVAGVVLVLLGLWGLTAPGGTLGGLIEPWRDGGFGLGDLMTLGCAFTFSIYILVLDNFSKDGPIIPYTAIQLVVCTLLAYSQSLLSESWKFPSGVGDWSRLLYLSIFATVFSTYWQTRYQRDTTPTRAAVIFTMESVFAAIFAMLVLGEHMGPIALAGGVLIVSGLLTIELPRSD
jgi:drug/metabolite transporter (DMT)-like permease